MSDVVHFPSRYDDFVRLAQQEMVKEKYSEAVPYLEKAYQKKQTLECNTMLAFCFYELKQYQSAVTCIKEMEEIYLSTAELTFFFLEMLIKTNQFLYARKIVLTHQAPDFYPSEWTERIEQAEYTYSIAEKQRVNQLKKQLVGISYESPNKQVEDIQLLKGLPIGDLRVFGDRLLADASLHPLARAKVLEYYVQNHIETKIKFIDYQNNERILDCRTLKMPSKQKELIAAKIELQEIGQNNPQLTQSIIQELDLQAAICYPVFDEAVKDGKTWVNQSWIYYEKILNGEENNMLNPIYLSKRQEMDLIIQNLLIE